MAYDAFVSYSHAVDGDLARALQSGMQRMAKPWYRVRALRVFRDDSALSANPHLWSAIQIALDDSRWFVLFASPDGAASEWMNRELGYWLGSKSVDRMLLVLTDGTLGWDGHALAGSAVPPSVSAAFADEPRHVDLRWAHDADDLDLRNSRFRDAVAQLAAPIHGIAKDELEGEDVQLHRRARQLARGGVSLLALLLVIALVMTGFALVQRHDATTQRDRAQRQADIANAERLAALATAHRDADPRASLLLAVEGYHRADTPTTRASLLGALTAQPQLVAFMPNSDGVTASAISPDGALVAAGTDDGSLRFWDVTRPGNTTQTVAPPSALRGEPVTSLTFDHRGSLFVLYRDGRVGEWDARSRTPEGAPMEIGDLNAPSIAVTADGRVIAVGGSLYDVTARRLIGSTATTAGSRFNGPSSPRSVFAPNGTTVFTSTQSGTSQYDVRTLEAMGAPLLSQNSSPSTCFGISGCFRLAGDNGAPLAAATQRTGSKHTIVAVGLGGAVSNAPSPAELADDLRGALVVDADTKRVVEKVAPTISVETLALTPDARTVVVADDRGTIEVWPAADAGLAGPVEPPMQQGGRVVSLSLSDNGQSLVSTAQGGSTILWDVSGVGALARVHALPEGDPRFNSTVPRLCFTSLAPFTQHDVTGVTFALRTCTSAVSMSPDGTDLAVSADQSSVWDVGNAGAVLVRALGRALLPIATPLAVDATGGRVLFASGFSTDNTSGESPLGTYESAHVNDDQPPQPAVNAYSIMSDSSSGPFVLGIKHGHYDFTKGLPTLYALDPWTNRQVGSIHPNIIVDALVQARRDDSEDISPTERSGSTSGIALQVLPLQAIIDSHGQRAATISEYGDVMLWDLRSGRPIGDPIIATGRATPVATAIAFSADGKELAVGRVDGSLTRYALPSLRAIATPIGGRTSAVGQISYDTSGKLLAVATADRVDLIDRLSDEQIATIPFPASSPVDVAFGGTIAGFGAAQLGDRGRLLVTDAYGTTVPALVWSLVPSDWIAAACDAAGRNITRTEWTQLVGKAVPYHATCPQWPVAN